MAKSIQEQLNQYMKTKEFQDRYDRFVEKNVKNGNSGIAKNVKDEVDKLKDRIQQEIDNYYTSYSPTIYSRTDNLKNSLVIVQTLNGFSITFDERLVYHDSVVYKDTQAYVPLLIEDGWHWNKSHQKIDRFTDFSGYPFVENGVEKYLQSAPKGVSIRIHKKTYYGDETEISYDK
ncbi:hypothetical protein [Anaerovorax sp. IOR16]|uniref:hypothetical protein n=1 Tax=Anaerovorax sp. IOR16 TaxID=2773458 RepID=UPI0019D16178|nr:hypothetical protein [Anaerovorax sp. IOR16]